MTLREKVAATNPGRLGDAYMGGVKSCPGRYYYLHGHFERCVCEGKNVTSEECNECWSQEYIECIERKEEKTVTLKDMVKEIRPEALDEKCRGGVRGCPKDYDFLLGHYTDCLCEEIAGPTGSGCEKCWGQEFIEHKEGKTVTLKDKIREVHPYDIAADADYYKSYGGVYKCVHDYTILKGCYEKLECNGDFRHRKNFQCEECWKQEYIPIENGAESEPEQVDHPAHYTQPGRRECIEEMRIVFGDEAVRQWCIITAYKYRYRAGNKESNSAEQDHSKAEWYLNYAENLR